MTLLQATATILEIFQFDRGYVKRENYYAEQVQHERFKPDEHSIKLAAEIIEAWDEDPETFVDSSACQDIAFCVHEWGKSVQKGTK